MHYGKNLYLEMLSYPNSCFLLMVDGEAIRNIKITPVWGPNQAQIRLSYYFITPERAMKTTKLYSAHYGYQNDDKSNF